MAATKIILTIGEQIDRARDGRTQTHIISKMNAIAKERKLEDWIMDDSKFSRKKLGHDEFTAEELEILSEVLGTEISIA